MTKTPRPYLEDTQPSSAVHHPACTSHSFGKPDGPFHMFHTPCDSEDHRGQHKEESRHGEQRPRDGASTQAHTLEAPSFRNRRWNLDSG